MKSIFNFEGPVFSFFEKLANLLWLDILWLVCSLPIVTIGASTTAMYYVTFKMIKDEETSIAKSFFKSFVQNFKQATIVWIVLLLGAGVVFLDTQMYVQDGTVISKGIHIIICVLGFILLLSGTYIFPLIAKFDNTTGNFVKNALILSIFNAPFTLIIIIMIIIPVAVVYFVPVLLPLSLFFGGSLVAYCSSFVFDKIFRRLLKDNSEDNNVEIKQQVEEIE